MKKIRMNVVTGLDNSEKSQEIIDYFDGSSKYTLKPMEYATKKFEKNLLKKFQNVVDGLRLIHSTEDNSSAFTNDLFYEVVLKDGKQIDDFKEIIGNGIQFSTTFQVDDDTLGFLKDFPKDYQDAKFVFYIFPNRIRLKESINTEYFKFLKENLYMNEDFDENSLYSFDYIEDRMQPQCAPGQCDDEDYYSIIRKLTKALGVKPRDWGNIYIYMDEYNYDVSPDQISGVEFKKIPIKGQKASVYETDGGTVLVDYTMSDSYPVLWFKNYNDAVRYLTWADKINSEEDGNAY